ncbi:methanol-5-hydroxybenzimidazolylcobamide methyltransferase [Methanosarcina sp. 2.H.T.1A.6]|uniref:methanol--corrinoid protein MtaC n=1 Tax=unclassified Methanosarcina TaxID=2644672 RepID=UPI0006223264|nr:MULTISPECIES: methanol--corrinoid protein MtaC [unclassified Methanosarcina]KKG14092.1 methanol-5-hydroxybenzimidazolylcobamide methyltransferase [Methanosarcina sp. 2.H.T.1A.15]KKG18017.1 methanol-5-hydroxybenzimidazolylcobamide methyltransferase [Methanosarcina sp. 2.H.T.1A.3]KKG19967.1 methanol-5-hydroxybenzimidazolylcobamide methyltransferase [Methanosarcina sp. 2.H.T.1A.6]KKG22631.1 methanol-5-hydroxybenzimidazolylcobamide methyltransferase [Methanosarcina sp. 2.H.T.1A.8]
MLDLKLEDIDGILVRYNVALEKEMTPDEAAEELYPKDELIYPIAKSIYEGEEEDVVDGLKAAIAAGKKPIDLINDALMIGMGVVSKLYDDGIIFLPNVMMSADAMLNGIEFCKSQTTEVPEPKGTVVCHVAEGDVHDIGKNIVAALLRAAGYDVTDLGRDVPVDEVIEAVVKDKPILLTGTALMTTTMYAFKEINDKLLEKGLKLPFACGGGAVNQDFVAQYDLGVYGEEASDAVKIADAILASGNDIEKLRAEFHKH